MYRLVQVSIGSYCESGSHYPGNTYFLKNNPPLILELLNTTTAMSRLTTNVIIKTAWRFARDWLLNSWVAKTPATDTAIFKVLRHNFSIYFTAVSHISRWAWSLVVLIDNQRMFLFFWRSAIIANRQQGCWKYVVHTAHMQVQWKSMGLWFTCKGMNTAQLQV